MLQDLFEFCTVESNSRVLYAPQAGGPINLKFLAHYDYLVSLESSGYREFKNVILRVIFSSATTRVTRKYQKGQKCADFGVFENKMANYWLWTSGNVVALGKMTLRMTFLNSL